MEAKEEATFNRSTKKRCVAVLYRAQHESNHEKFEPYHLLKKIVIGGYNADEINEYDLSHDQIPWNEDNRFYSKYANENTNVVYLANVFLYAYLKNPSRVTIFPESEINIHDIQKRINNNPTAKFFFSKEEPFENFERRLCLEFKTTQKDFQELLADTFTAFDGKTTLYPENIMKAARQLKQNITFARFDLYNKQTEQWLTYKTLSRLTALEEFGEECGCRIC